MDADRIEGHPANAALAPLAAGGRRSGPGEQYAIDGWDLRAHPDLEERLQALAKGLRGGLMTAYRGYPVVVDGEGAVLAIATGTAGLLLRLPGGPARDAVLAHGGEPRPDLGPDWVRADPWLSDVPSAEGMALLRGWLAASLEAGTEARRGPTTATPGGRATRTGSNR